MSDSQKLFPDIVVVKTYRAEISDLDDMLFIIVYNISKCKARTIIYRKLDKLKRLFQLVSPTRNVLITNDESAVVNVVRVFSNYPNAEFYVFVAKKYVTIV